MQQWPLEHIGRYASESDGGAQAKTAKSKNHTNVLQHLQGYFKQRHL